MMGNITVWVKEPNKEPVQKDIPNTLEALQEVVGGNIEHVALYIDVGLLANEEGILLGLPYNCRVDGLDIYGTFLWIGYDGEEFDSCPLTRDAMELFYSDLFEKKGNVL